jgi:hypothetical protein
MLSAAQSLQRHRPLTHLPLAPTRPPTTNPNQGSHYFNVSISVAFTYHNPTTDAVETTAAAGGYTGGGAVATIDSLYPGGSVDKFFTAVSDRERVSE